MKNEVFFKKVKNFSTPGTLGVGTFLGGNFSGWELFCTPVQEILVSKAVFVVVDKSSS